MVWLFSLLSFLPVFRLDLHLSNQIAAPLFFISYLILVFAWALSGPVTAAVLSVLSAVTALYLALGMKEPVFFVQIILYAVLFVAMVTFLLKTQKITNDQQLAIEKYQEEIHLTEDERQKKLLLAEALDKYTGAMIIVSHVPEFVKQIRIDEVLDLEK